ncbi:MAG: hypothetical protein K0R29_1034 [Pseudobdellovibrio sp.]|nr:hypothetical protein [Pseudobdellovibrio sp.]
MKHLITLLLLAVSFKSNATLLEAKPLTLLEAKPLTDLINTIHQTEFKFIEIGKSFGFNTTKSCLHASADMVVLKNYCFPKKEYPAKGYTIISPKFGIVELYQEQMSATIQKRDVHYSVFSEELREVVDGDVSALKIADTNKVIEYFYKKQPAACWSSNWSYYTNKPDVACNQRAVDVVGFEEWAKETQEINGNEVLWKELIYNLEEKFKD